VSKYTKKRTRRKWFDKTFALPAMLEEYHPRGVQLG